MSSFFYETLLDKVLLYKSSFKAFHFCLIKLSDLEVPA